MLTETDDSFAHGIEGDVLPAGHSWAATGTILNRIRSLQ